MGTPDIDGVTEVTEALSRTVIFSSLKPVELEPLAVSAKIVSLRSSEILWTEGGVADHLGVVLTLSLIHI